MERFIDLAEVRMCLLSRFLLIHKLLWNMYNVGGAIAVMAGLTSGPISRLQKTFKVTILWLGVCESVSESVRERVCVCVCHNAQLMLFFRL